MSEKSIILIVGDGRSGSSLLEAQLSRAFGLAALGEARWFFERGLRDDDLCSCGERFSSCGFWSSIRESLRLGTHGESEVTSLAEKLDLGSQKKFLKNMCLRFWREGDMEKLIAAAQSIWVYAENETKFGLIDSSKSVPYFFLLCYHASLFDRVRVVHIVRDPRSVAASRQRPRTRVESNDSVKRQMPLVGPVKSSFMWLLANVSAELFCCFVKTATRVRYEDFVDDCDGSISRISSSLDLRMTNEHENNDLYHSMSGNPSRFEADFDSPKRRKTEAPVLSWLVSILTWPLRVRYGYIGGLRSQ